MNKSNTKRKESRKELSRRTLDASTASKTSNPKLGYIISLKKGVHRFIYRELCELEKDFQIAIFPTKRGLGPHMPKEDWEVFPFSKLSLLFHQFTFFLSHPFIYCKNFFKALNTSSFVDFVVATQFSSNMKKAGVDRIHAHFGDHKLFIGYYCKQFTNLPLTVTIHAHELYRNPNWKMFSHALLGADKIISISEFNKKELIERFNVPSDKIEVIRLFVDPEKDSLDSSLKKILVIGSFEERKGYDVLFKALKQLNRKDYVVWIVGDGHLPVKEWAGDLPVKFLGTFNSDTMNILFDACDLFVLPSKTVKVAPVKGSNITASGEDREGIPVVLMEAMLAGKPVISTRHAGIPELVKDILVEEDNPSQLSNAINKVLSNFRAYSLKGKKNRALVLSKYSKANVKRLKNLFMEYKK